MIYLEKLSNFAGKTFAVWVLILAFLAFFFPESFTWIGPYISILLGIVMFGMGMTLSFNDFKLVFKQPKGILIGVFAQFIIMPSTAYLIAKVFNLPPEIAVGVILVGSCPGGTASNVMTFLAKGNVPLSVTVTSISTLLSPILTPALIYFFANEWLQVSALAMFWSVVKVVLIPIILGLFAKAFFSKTVEKSGKAMPLVSVIAIVMIVAAVVSGNKQNIIESGLLIFAVVILHNGIGYLLGFWASKLFKLDYPDQKAIAIEVGMQNSGLGVALATAHFSPLAAVPSAIFSFWHNISGPLLATFWSNKHQKMQAKLAVNNSNVKMEENKSSIAK